MGRSVNRGGGKGVRTSADLNEAKRRKPRRGRKDKRQVNRAVKIIQRQKCGDSRRK